MKGEIPSPRWESNPRTPIVQPVAQRYTDWTITDLGQKVTKVYYVEILKQLHEAVRRKKS
jgi:hypothetical protein